MEEEETKEVPESKEGRTMQLCNDQVLNDTTSR